MRRTTMSMLTGITAGLIAGVGMTSYMATNKKMRKPVK